VRFIQVVALATGVMAVMLAVGCAHEDEALRGEMNVLRTQLAETNRAVNDIKVKMETLQTRVLMLEDRPKTGSRSSSAAEVQKDINRLKVVRLLPETQQEDEDDNWQEAQEQAERPRRGTPTIRIMDGVSEVVEHTGQEHRNSPAAEKEAQGKKQFDEAISFYRQKQYTAAVREFTTFLKANPGNTLGDDAVYYMGLCYLEDEEYQLAIDEFQRVLEWPNADCTPDAMLALAISYQGAGKADKALEMLEMLNRRYPDSAAAQKARVYLDNDTR